MKTARRYFCYIVQCADGTLYTGWTVDVAARVKTHNAGLGALYTRLRRPVKLVYTEALPSRAAAMKRERQIKRYSRAKKTDLALCTKSARIKGKRRVSQTRRL